MEEVKKKKRRKRDKEQGRIYMIGNRERVARRIMAFLLCNLAAFALGL